MTPVSTRQQQQQQQAVAAAAADQLLTPCSSLSVCADTVRYLDCIDSASSRQSLTTVEIAVTCTWVHWRLGLGSFVDWNDYDVMCPLSVRSSLVSWSLLSLLLSLLSTGVHRLAASTPWGSRALASSLLVAYLLLPLPICRLRHCSATSSAAFDGKQNTLRSTWRPRQTGVRLLRLKRI